MKNKPIFDDIRGVPLKWCIFWILIGVVVGVSGFYSGMHDLLGIIRWLG